jgi:hypothetical protein
MEGRKERRREGRREEGKEEKKGNEPPKNGWDCKLQKNKQSHKQLVVCNETHRVTAPSSCQLV